MKRLLIYWAVIVTAALCVSIAMHQRTVNAQASPNQIVISQDPSSRVITVQLCNASGCQYLAFTSQPTTVADVVVNKLYSGL